MLNRPALVQNAIPDVLSIFTYGYKVGFQVRVAANKRSFGITGNEQISDNRLDSFTHSPTNHRVGFGRSNCRPSSMTYTMALTPLRLAILRRHIHTSLESERVDQFMDFDVQFPGGLTGKRQSARLVQGVQSHASQA